MTGIPERLDALSLAVLPLAHSSATRILDGLVSWPVSTFRRKCVRWRWLCYAFWTAIGSPAAFGATIATDIRSEILQGYVIGGSPMPCAAIVESFLGIEAEERSPEYIARRLSHADLPFSA